MPTAPTLPAVPVEEYLRTEYEPRCEYLEGVLLPKSAPDYVHSTLQALLILFFGSQRSRFPGLKVRSELHTRISPGRYRIPDVAGVLQLPADGRYPDSQAPPLFTIEIASLDESMHTLKGKVADHLKLGVSTVIIADPYDKTVMTATQTMPLREIASPLLVDIAFPNGSVLQVDFDDLYRRLDIELTEPGQ